MSRSARLRPEALLAGFGVAAVLGFGSGYFIGDLRQSGRAAHSATTTTAVRPTTSTLPPPTVRCRFQGQPAVLRRPAFVAGVLDGGVAHVAQAFGVERQLPVTRRALVDARAREAFGNEVATAQRSGPGLLLVQQGRLQLDLARRLAAEGVAVVVVLPADGAPLADYPAGTLGVFTGASAAEQATLTAGEAADVVRVLRDRVPCPTSPTEGEIP